MAGLDNLQQGGDGIMYPPESCTNLDIAVGFGYDFMTYSQMAYIRKSVVLIFPEI